MTLVCPVCDEGVLQSASVTETVRYDGADLSVPEIEIHRCGLCGEETVMPDQLKRNALRFADAKRRHDEILTTAEIVHWRTEFGITQAQAASVLGGGVNAFSKYERGEVSPSKSMDLLMRVSGRFPEVRRYLMQRAGLPVVSRDWVSLAPQADRNDSFGPTAPGVLSVQRLEIMESNGWTEQRWSNV